MRQTIVVLVLAGLAGACATSETADRSIPLTTSSTTVVVETTAAPQTTPAPETTLPPATTSPPTTVPALPTFTFQQGVVEGPETLEVTLGEEAAFAVTSDVVDEVHVHGFDLHFDLEPGVATEVRFVADVPGVFEVEVESSHTAVVDLVVEP